MRPRNSCFCKMCKGKPQEISHMEEIKHEILLRIGIHPQISKSLFFKTAPFIGYTISHLLFPVLEGSLPEFGLWK